MHDRRALNGKKSAYYDPKTRKLEQKRKEKFNGKPYLPGSFQLDSAVHTSSSTSPATKIIMALVFLNVLNQMGILVPVTAVPTQGDKRRGKQKPKLPEKRDSNHARSNAAKARTQTTQQKSQPSKTATPIIPSRSTKTLAKKSMQQQYENSLASFLKSKPKQEAVVRKLESLSTKTPDENHMIGKYYLLKFLKRDNDRLDPNLYAKRGVKLIIGAYQKTTDPSAKARYKDSLIKFLNFFSEQLSFLSEKLKTLPSIPAVPEIFFKTRFYKNLESAILESTELSESELANLAHVTVGDRDIKRKSWEYAVRQINLDSHGEGLSTSIRNLNILCDSEDADPLLQWSLGKALKHNDEYDHFLRNVNTMLRPDKTRKARACYDAEGVLIDAIEVCIRSKTYDRLSDYCNQLRLNPSKSKKGYIALSQGYAQCGIHTNTNKKTQEKYYQLAISFLGKAEQTNDKKPKRFAPQETILKDQDALDIAVIKRRIVNSVDTLFVEPHRVVTKEDISTSESYINELTMLLGQELLVPNYVNQGRPPKTREHLQYSQLQFIKDKNWSKALEAAKLLSHSSEMGVSEQQREQHNKFYDWLKIKLAAGQHNFNQKLVFSQIKPTDLQNGSPLFVDNAGDYILYLISENQFTQLDEWHKKVASKIKDTKLASKTCLAFYKGLFTLSQQPNVSKKEKKSLLAQAEEYLVKAEKSYIRLPVSYVQPSREPSTSFQRSIIVEFQAQDLAHLAEDIQKAKQELKDARKLLNLGQDKRSQLEHMKLRSYQQEIELGSYYAEKYFAGRPSENYNLLQKALDCFENAYNTAHGKLSARKFIGEFEDKLKKDSLKYRATSKSSDETENPDVIFSSLNWVHTLDLIDKLTPTSIKESESTSYTDIQRIKLMEAKYHSKLGIRTYDYFKKGEYEPALPLINQNLYMNPDNLDMYYYKIIALMALEKHDEAFEISTYLFDKFENNQLLDTEIKPRLLLSALVSLAPTRVSPSKLLTYAHILEKIEPKTSQTKSLLTETYLISANAFPNRRAELLQKAEHHAKRKDREMTHKVLFHRIRRLHGMQAKNVTAQPNNSGWGIYALLTSFILIAVTFLWRGTRAQKRIIKKSNKKQPNANKNKKTSPKKENSFSLKGNKKIAKQLFGLIKPYCKASWKASNDTIEITISNKIQTPTEKIEITPDELVSALADYIEIDIPTSNKKTVFKICDIQCAVKQDLPKDLSNIMMQILRSRLESKIKENLQKNIKLKQDLASLETDITSLGIPSKKTDAQLKIDNADKNVNYGNTLIRYAREIINLKDPDTYKNRQDETSTQLTEDCKTLQQLCDVLEYFKNFTEELYLSQLAKMTKACQSLDDASELVKEIASIENLYLKMKDASNSYAKALKKHRQRQKFTASQYGPKDRTLTREKKRPTGRTKKPSQIKPVKEDLPLPEKPVLKKKKKPVKKPITMAEFEKMKRQASAIPQPLLDQVKSCIQILENVESDKKSGNKSAVLYQLEKLHGVGSLTSQKVYAQILYRSRLYSVMKSFHTLGLQKFRIQKLEYFLPSNDACLLVRDSIMHPPNPALSQSEAICKLSHILIEQICPLVEDKQNLQNKNKVKDTAINLLPKPLGKIKNPEKQALIDCIEQEFSFLTEVANICSSIINEKGWSAFENLGFLHHAIRASIFTIGQALKGLYFVDERSHKKITAKFKDYPSDETQQKTLLSSTRGAHGNIFEKLRQKIGHSFDTEKHKQRYIEFADVKTSTLFEICIAVKSLVPSKDMSTQAKLLQDNLGGPGSVDDVMPLKAERPPSPSSNYNPNNNNNNNNNVEDDRSSSPSPVT